MNRLLTGLKATLADIRDCVGYDLMSIQYGGGDYRYYLSQFEEKPKWWQLLRARYQDVAYPWLNKHRRLAVAYFWVSNVWLHIKYMCGVLMCKHFGHAWEDHSCAGPDTGNIYMCCRRCGCSHYHTLY